MFRAAVIAALISIGSPAGAEEDSAAELFASGAEHLQAGRFADATRDLRAAFALEPSKQIHWALAHAERFAGNCDRAIPLYEQFADRYPDGEKSVEAARGFASECRDKLAARYRALLDRAAEQRAAGDHRAAIESYKEAEAASIDGGAVAILERARTHVAAADCPAAIPIYRRFIERHPDNPSIAGARAELATCERQAELAKQIETRDDASGGDEAGRRSPPPPAIEREARPWYGSRLGWTLAASGTAALATGATLVILGRRTGGDPGGDTYGDHEDSWNGARLRYTAGWAMVGVGAAVAVAGVWRLATFGIDPVNRSVTAAVRF